MRACHWWCWHNVYIMFNVVPCTSAYPLKVVWSERMLNMWKNASLRGQSNLVSSVFSLSWWYALSFSLHIVCGPFYHGTHAHAQALICIQTCVLMQSYKQNRNKRRIQTLLVIWILAAKFCFCDRNTGTIGKQDRGGGQGEGHRKLVTFWNCMLFSSFQGVLFMLMKAHMRSTPSFRSFPSVAWWGTGCEVGWLTNWNPQWQQPLSSPHPSPPHPLLRPQF